MCLGMNDESYSEPGMAESECKQFLAEPNKPLFEALELNFDMLMSPVILVPWALTRSDSQMYYYALKPKMAVLLGPKNSPQEVLACTQLRV